MSSVTEVEMIHELGYKYKVIFGEMGHRCGYVYIPRDYLLSDDMKFAISPDSDGLTIRELEYFSLMLNYNENFDVIKVHGGITFNEALEDVDINESEDFIYCLGFHCGHGGDKKDEECFEKYFPENFERFKTLSFSGLNSFWDNGSIIRTKLFCVQECLNLIKQLESMRSKK